jgi:hypothetical protein
LMNGRDRSARLCESTLKEKEPRRVLQLTVCWAYGESSP